MVVHARSHGWSNTAECCSRPAETMGCIPCSASTRPANGTTNAHSPQISRALTGSGEPLESGTCGANRALAAVIDVLFALELSAPGATVGAASGHRRTKGPT